MKVRKGFTLIELLVVVAIIALLIAILMPALARAKTLAKRTVCLTHLKAIGLATRAYASGNEDQMVEVSGAAGTGNFAQALLTTYTVISQTGGTDAGYGLGRLFTTGYLSDIRVAWCPTQPDVAFNMDPGNVILPWDSKYSKATKVMYRSSYDYQANHNGNALAYTKLGQYPEFLRRYKSALNPLQAGWESFWRLT